MSEPPGTRKRPASPRSRGDSPPTQRRRQSEYGNMSDRYANIKYPRYPPSLPYYKMNSATGSPDNARWRSAHYSIDERRVDQNRRNSSRDVLPSHEKSQSGVRLANSRNLSRDQIKSPMSNRSGSSTPVQVAPTVPSMPHVSQRLVTERSGPMDTLNALRSHKSLCSVNNPQATCVSNTTEVRVLKEQLKAAEMESAKLRVDLKRLEDHQKQLVDLPAQLHALKSLVGQQQTATKNSILEDLEHRLGNLENAKPPVSAQQFAEMQGNMEATKADVEMLRSSVAQPGKNSASKDLLQAITKDEAKAMIQAALEPQTKKMVTLRTQQGNDLKDLSKMMEANRKICDDLKQRDIPGQLRTLEDNINRVESNEKKFWDKASTFDRKVDNIQRNLESLERRIYGSHGVGGRSYPEADETVVQRLKDLESTSQSVRKEQDHLQESQKALSALVKKPPAAPSRPSSPTPCSIQSRLEASVEAINTRISDLEAVVKGIGIEQTSQRSITGQVKAFESGLSTLTGNCKNLSASQEALQNSYKTSIERLEKTEGRYLLFFNDHKAMAEQVKELQSEQLSLANQKKSIQMGQASDQMLNKIRHLADEQVKANDRITKLETSASSTMRTQQNNGPNHSDFIPSSSGLDNIQQRLRSVEDCVGGKDGLNTVFKELESDVEEINQEMHDLKNSVVVLSASFKEIFAEQFDPFKKTVDEHLEMHSRKLSQHSQSLSTLEDQVAEAQHECPAPTFSTSQVLSIRSMILETAQATPDLSHLQESMNAEMAQVGAALEDLKRQLASKQDIVNLIQSIDTMKAAVRNLQNQYDNISTDDLHQKMVHWFVQNYPAPTANLLLKFDVIQHDIAQLRGFLDLITRIPNGVQSLGKLAQIGPQITALIQSPQGSKEVEGKLAKTDEALDALRQSVASARTQQESLGKAVNSLQTTMQKLNSGDATFVRTESRTALEQSVSSLQADVEAGFRKEAESRAEAATKTSNEQQQRVKAETSIRTMINDRFDHLENGKIRTMVEQIEGLQQTLQAFKDFESSRDKELIESLPILIQHIGEMQCLCEDLNQNLPRAPLDLHWSYDWKKELKIKGPYDYDPETEEVAGQGMAKQ